MEWSNYNLDLYFIWIEHMIIVLSYLILSYLIFSSLILSYLILLIFELNLLILDATPQLITPTNVHMYLENLFIFLWNFWPIFCKIHVHSVQISFIWCRICLNWQKVQVFNQNFFTQLLIKMGWILDLGAWSRIRTSSV